MSKPEEGAVDRAFNRSMLVKLFVVAALMFGFGFALMPMYRAICQITGINNLVQRDVSARGRRARRSTTAARCRWSSMRMRAARSVSSRSTASTCIRAS
jgi:cytochrome c oxidase assembly protein Cox11